MVRHERARRGAAVDRLQRRGLDLDEPAVVQEAAHRRDRLRPGDEHGPGVRVGHQVEVALAEPDLGVADAGVLVRRRAQRLRQERHPGGRHGELAAAGARDGAVGADDVPQVEVEGRGHAVLAEAVDRRPHLDPAAAVLQVQERDPPLAAAREPGGPRRAPAAPDSSPAASALVRRAHVRDLDAPREPGRERVDAGVPEGVRLRPALRDQRREAALRRGRVSRCAHQPGCPRSGSGSRRAVRGS